MWLGVSWKFWLGSALIACLFLLFPQIDLAISGLFFNEAGFYLKNHPFARAVYDYAPVATAIFVLAALAAYTVMRVAKRHTLLNMNRSAYLFLVLVMLIGPGLVVNAFFKDHFGRARPAHIVQFGGDKTFTPPFVITDQCGKNCSFSSGHATVGFYFVALSLVLSGAAARAVFWFAFMYGWLIGFVRIVQGGHFFSDVLFSFVFVYLSAKILYHFMFERKHKPA